MTGFGCQPTTGTSTNPLFLMSWTNAVWTPPRHTHTHTMGETACATTTTTTTTRRTHTHAYNVEFRVSGDVRTRPGGPVENIPTVTFRTDDEQMLTFCNTTWWRQQRRRRRRRRQWSRRRFLVVHWGLPVGEQRHCSRKTAKWLSTVSLVCSSCCCCLFAGVTRSCSCWFCCGSCFVPCCVLYRVAFCCRCWMRRIASTTTTGARKNRVLFMHQHGRRADC